MAKAKTPAEHSEHWNRTRWEASGARFSGVPFLPKEDAASASAPAPVEENPVVDEASKEDE